MAIGRTFKEALQKGLRGLETGRHGLGEDGRDRVDPDQLNWHLATPNPERIFYVKYALKYACMSLEQVHAMTGIDPWFLNNILELIAIESDLEKLALE